MQYCKHTYISHQDNTYEHRDDAAIHCTMVWSIFHSHGMYWGGILCMRGICLQYRWERSAPDNGRAYAYIARSANTIRSIGVQETLFRLSSFSQIEARIQRETDSNVFTTVEIDSYRTIKEVGSGYGL
jgi:hypothetical protein